MAKLAFADAHCHSNPVSGLGAKAIAERFAKAGGWFLALVMLPSWSYGARALTLDEYLKLVRLHVAECKAAREAGLKVACLAGFHPAEIDRAVESGLSYYGALELGLKVLEELFKLCSEGVLQGVGEIGRQHYKTRPESVTVANELLRAALEMSRDTSCLLQVHAENTPAFTARNLKSMADSAGASYSRIVVHHARPGFLEEVVASGFWATTPCVRGGLGEALRRVGSRSVLVESDFLDDPRRPGAVAVPWECPEVQLELLRSGVVTERVLEAVNVDNVERVFEVSY